MLILLQTLNQKMTKKFNLPLQSTNYWKLHFASFPKNNGMGEVVCTRFFLLTLVRPVVFPLLMK